MRQVSSLCHSVSILLPKDRNVRHAAAIAFVSLGTSTVAVYGRSHFGSKSWLLVVTVCV